MNRDIFTDIIVFVSLILSIFVPNLHYLALIVIFMVYIESKETMKSMNKKLSEEIEEVKEKNRKLEELINKKFNNREE